MQQARSRFSTEQIIFVGAALVLIIGIQLPVAHYLSPKSGLGYAIGIVGGTLILAQLLYAVRKRVRSLRWLGSVPGWFQTHMMMGIIGPVCILVNNLAFGMFRSKVSHIPPAQPFFPPNQHQQNFQWGAPPQTPQHTMGYDVYGGQTYQAIMPSQTPGQRSPSKGNRSPSKEERSPSKGRRSPSKGESF